MVSSYKGFEEKTKDRKTIDERDFMLTHASNVRA